MVFVGVGEENSHLFMTKADEYYDMMRISGIKIPFSITLFVFTETTLGGSQALETKMIQSVKCFI